MRNRVFSIVLAFVSAFLTLFLVSGCATTGAGLAGKPIHEIIKTLPDPAAPPVTTREAKIDAAKAFLQNYKMIILAGLTMYGTPVQTDILLKEKKTITYWRESACSSGYMPITTGIDAEGNVEISVKTKARNADDTPVKGCPDFVYTINPENGAVVLNDYFVEEVDGKKVIKKVGPYRRLLVEKHS